MKKTVKVIEGLLLVLLLALIAVVVLLEFFPGTEAGKLVDPYCRGYYQPARDWTVARCTELWKLCRPGAEGEEESARPAEPEKPAVIVEEVPLKEPKPVVPKQPKAEKPAADLRHTEWFTPRKLVEGDLRNRIGIVAVFSTLDDAAADILAKAQRVSDGFRGKPMVVFASYRGEEKASVVKRFLEKHSVSIPVDRTIGHPSEPKGIGARSVLYLVDREGKAKYLGTDDKTLIVKLVDML